MKASRLSALPSYCTTCVEQFEIPAVAAAAPTESLCIGRAGLSGSSTELTEG